ncbi:MAG: FAD-dependent thymidylate synthase [Chitinispirillaceae bacterium]|nr:FAD-dependent thymidylate synthase [Chitinispirillaceae bacterium]
MNIKALAIRPPPSGNKQPAVTPELLASSLARYSRSNKGIDTILGSIDWDDPNRSVDAIFRFVDYGHASIAGMTGGIPIVVDGCTMFLAYKLFEIAQLCDGQESSTRYIRLTPSALPAPASLGIPESLADRWSELMRASFSRYDAVYAELDAKATADPTIIRIPAGASDKVAERLRKNYALDRARYFIPFATRTNAAYIMTARVWADTIKRLDSLPLPEAHTCAEGLRREVAKFAPRLMRHSYPDAASTAQAKHDLQLSVAHLRNSGLPVAPCTDRVMVSVERSQPPFYPYGAVLSSAFDGKENRYSTVGTSVKRLFVRAAWNNMAIAELRDLNRHRSGCRFSPLAPVGFYLPSEISRDDCGALFEKAQSFCTTLTADEETAAAYVYGLHLGTQVYFEHSTHLDKFIYEIELRTGMGAHFRYAEHLLAAHRELCKALPEIEPFIEVGTAEPE